MSIKTLVVILKVKIAVLAGCMVYCLTRVITGADGDTVHLWVSGVLTGVCAILIAIGLWVVRRAALVQQINILFGEWKNAINAADEAAETDEAVAISALEHGKLIREKCLALLRRLGGSAAETADAIEADIGGDEWRDKT